VVHNAVRVRDFPFTAAKDGYALFLGRVCPEKGLPTAISAARAAGIPLLIAAKCTEPPEREYFERMVRPALGRGTTWLGEVGGEQKRRLLARARCLLFPIDWEEPFGMVLIEALACGTPVVAMRRGAVPEVVSHGLTGLLAERAEQLPDLLHEVGHIDPRACRAEAERRFDVARMAADYEAVYERVLDHRTLVGRAPHAPDDATPARHLRDRGPAGPAPLEGPGVAVG
jgi:glycosyltransferase involved in cell wall biosynthesis